MKMPIIEAYLDDLIKNSTLDVPAWNIEAARKGGKSGWNYIDGCMILAMIETWKITGEKKYLDFAEAYIDHRVQEDGTIKGYNPEDYNIDNVNAYAAMLYNAENFIFIFASEPVIHPNIAISKASSKAYITFIINKYINIDNPYLV